MRQTELEVHAELELVATVRGEVVTPQDPVELRDQHLDQYVGAAGRVDLEQRIQPGAEAPGPLPVAVLLVAGLIDVQPRLAGQVVEQLLIGSLQRPADLGDDPGQFAARDRHPHDVAEELADGGVGGVARPLEVGDQRGQGRPDQAAPRDPRRERGVVHLLTARAPPRMTAVLLDRQSHLADVDLLDHPWRDGQGRPQAMAAQGAGVDAMIEGPAVEGLGREGGSLVLGMAGLAADAAPVLSLRRRRLGWLDDVGGRWLGGGRGVLARGGELLPELGDDLLEGGEFRLRGIDSRLESSAIGAADRVTGSHGGLFYTPRNSRDYT